MIKFRRILVLAIAFISSTALVGLATPSPASAAISTSCTAVNASAQWSYKTSYTFSTAKTWCSNSGGELRRVVWQSDGNLVAYAGFHTGGKATWASGTNGRGAKLVFQTDGNVVIYNLSGGAIWATGTNSNKAAQLSEVFWFGVYSCSSDNPASNPCLQFDVDSWNHSAGTPPNKAYRRSI